MSYSPTVYFASMTTFDFASSSGALPVTVAVDSKGTSVHDTGPKEWQAKIGKIPVAAA